jgi:hypothetical protein
MKIIVRDGIIEEENPAGIYGYVDVPLYRWANDWPFV